MLAPSATARTPLPIRVGVVAVELVLGGAGKGQIAPATSHGRLLAWKLTPKWSAYSLMRPRRTSLSSLSHASFSSSMPSGSWMKPAGVRRGDHLGSELIELLDAVDGDVARARHGERLAPEPSPAVLEHVLA